MIGRITFCLVSWDCDIPALLQLPMSSGEGEDEMDGSPVQSGMETSLFRLRASLERGKKIKSVKSHLYIFRDSPRLFPSHISLHVHSRPLDVVYSRYTTDRLLSFLRQPWAGERGGAYQQFGAELRSHTTAGIRHRLEELLEGEKKVNCKTLCYIVESF